MEYRQYITQEQNYLDAVIGLSANLFYGTSIPACILVFKKCRVHDDDILFIDASQHFEKVGNQNALTDDHVAKIVETYQNRENIDKYAYAAHHSLKSKKTTITSISRATWIRSRKRSRWISRRLRRS